jgi:ABC-type bacteriocin/lantibiotic exporter with double-glycine peptidase domain
MNIGQFVAAEIIILLILDSSEKIITTLESVYDMFTSLEKIEEIKTFQLDDNFGTQTLNPMSKGITLELINLKFGYNSNDLIINDLSYTFKVGQKYCIAGENGSGKSTLLHLISGNYKPNQGNICINELPIQNYHKEHLAKHIGSALIEETIFESTILENITLGRIQLNTDQINQLLKTLFLTDFIKSLPNGINTILDPSGKKIPQSIHQKIIIARSIATSPSLLIIESNVDAIERIEKNKIIDYLLDKNNNQTVIISSNDDYIISKCDENITLKNGRIIEINSKYFL